MALQVWLPLDGNLNNNGLDDVTITNNGAVVNNDGKIGKCYSPATITITNITNLSFNNSSYCFWAKTNSTSSWQLIIGIDNASNSQIHGIYVADSARLKLEYNPSLNVNNAAINNWHHYAFVVVDGKSLCYYDGVLANTSTEAVTDDAIKRLRLGVGGSIFLNDVRIYNHALSPKEVKEISKGLILHYTLDNIDGYGNPNLIADFDTSFLSYAVGATTLFTNQMANGTQEIVQNQANVEKSLHLHSLGGSNRQYRTLAALAGHTYTISAEYYSPVTQATAWRGELNGGNYSWLGSTAGAYDTPGEWKKMSYTYTNLTSNATIYFFIYCAQDTDCYVRNIKIEEGSVVTEWRPGNYSSTMIYDCSGYGHHGNYTGNITLMNNSARYQYCTYLSNGQSDYITTIDPVGNPSDAITMNIWFKSSNKTPGSDYHHMFNGLTSWVYIEMAVHKDGYLRCGLYINGTRYVANCGSGILDGKWHMLTMTYDGANVKRYVDGVLLSTQAATGAIDRPNDKFIFGHGTSTGYYCKEAYLSDARIYATALSADDIRQLYKVPTIVDNEQNLYTYEFVESTEALINKTGVFNSTQLFEQGPFSTMYDKQIYTEPDGSSWLHIFHHNNPAAARFGSTNTFASGAYLDANRWYNVEQALGIAYQYEFMVKQKTTSDAAETKWRWIQNINPMVATWNDVKPGTITYITTSGYTNGGMGGMYYRNNTNQRMCIANGSSGNWFGGIGVWEVYQGGIPGYPNTTVTTGYVDLYLRIYPQVQIHKDGQVKANCLYEF